MFSSFEKTCLSREAEPLEWNQSLVLGSLLVCLTSHLSCPQISTLPGRQVSYWPSLLPIRVSELHGLSFRIWHSWAWKPCMISLISDFMIKTQNPLDSRSSQFFPWMTSWMVIETSRCCVPSGLSGNTCPAWSSITLVFPISSSRQVRERNRCLATPFCFGLDWSSAMSRLNACFQ